MNIEKKARTGQRVALASVVVSAFLAVIKITIGHIGHSTAVVADGLESAGDVVASSFVLVGFFIAVKPADKEHPYGHGRYETLTGFVVGIILILGGIGISYRSLAGIGSVRENPAPFALLPLAISMVAKAILSVAKFRYGRQLGSSALLADAWNDLVDLLSAITAMTSLGLTLMDPGRFLAADHYGGFAVGLIVIFTGLRVAKDTSQKLTDKLPAPALLDEIRSVANQIQGVTAVEKCYARSTGLQYHVELHIEVDPEMTVQASHEIATETRFAIRRQLDWISDVLVHVEPSPRFTRQNIPPGPSGAINGEQSDPPRKLL